MTQPDLVWGAAGLLGSMLGSSTGGMSSWAAEDWRSKDKEKGEGREDVIRLD